MVRGGQRVGYIEPGKLQDFRAESGDDVLRSHLAKAGANATYMSDRS